jgi:hypothetical protein
MPTILNGLDLGSILPTLYGAFNGERLVYPSLSNGATVISANADWVYGD